MERYASLPKHVIAAGLHGVAGDPNFETRIVRQWAKIIEKFFGLGAELSNEWLEGYEWGKEAGQEPRPGRVRKARVYYIPWRRGTKSPYPSTKIQSDPPQSQKRLQDGVGVEIAVTVDFEGWVGSGSAREDFKKLRKKFERTLQPYVRDEETAVWVQTKPLRTRSRVDGPTGLMEHSASVRYGFFTTTGKD